MNTLGPAETRDGTDGPNLSRSTQQVGEHIPGRDERATEVEAEPRGPSYALAVSEGDHEATARAVYDAGAEAYLQFVGPEIGPTTEGPIDRSLLVAFVELVRSVPAARVADVGCGPGRVAAFLAAHGLDVIGVDVSPVMVALARRTHPEIEFHEGRLTAIPVPDGSLTGVVCWYSIMYTPPEHLEDVFGELGRVLRPGGHLLLAFQAGDGEGTHRADAHGTGLPLTTHSHDPDEVARRLTEAGCQVHARAVREQELAHEATPQAFIFARAGRST